MAKALLHVFMMMFLMCFKVFEFEVKNLAADITLDPKKNLSKIVEVIFANVRALKTLLY